MCNASGACMATTEAQGRSSTDSATGFEHTPCPHARERIVGKTGRGRLRSTCRRSVSRLITEYRSDHQPNCDRPAAQRVGGHRQHTAPAWVLRTHARGTTLADLNLAAQFRRDDQEPSTRPTQTVFLGLRLAALPSEPTVNVGSSQTAGTPQLASRAVVLSELLMIGQSVQIAISPTIGFHVTRTGRSDRSSPAGPSCCYAGCRHPYPGDYPGKRLTSYCPSVG